MDSPQPTIPAFGFTPPRPGRRTNNYTNEHVSELNAAIRTQDYTQVQAILSTPEGREAAGIDDNSNNRNYPLHFATIEAATNIPPTVDSIAIIDALLATGNTDINIQNDDESSPLHLAANNPDLVTILMERGASLRTVNVYGNTPLTSIVDEAVEQGVENEKLDKYLTLIADVISSDSNQLTRHNNFEENLLQRVMRQTADHTESHSEVKNLLIQHLPQEQLEHRNCEGDTVLGLAAMAQDIESIEQLLHKGADINAVNSEENTALQLATKGLRERYSDDYQQHYPTVKALLKHQPDMGNVNREGNTALHLAAEGSNQNIFRDILSRSSNLVNVQNAMGNTPISLAAGHEDYKTARLFCKRLLTHNADVAIDNAFGWTPLHTAISDVRPQLAKTLISPFILNHQEMDGGNTPLHLAAYESRAQSMVTTLLSHGSNPSIKNIPFYDAQGNITGGMTPLHIAAVSNPQIIEPLVRYGSDTTSIDAAGKRPRDHVDPTNAPLTQKLRKYELTQPLHHLMAASKGMYDTLMLSVFPTAILSNGKAKDVFGNRDLLHQITSYLTGDIEPGEFARAGYYSTQESFQTR